MAKKKSSKKRGTREHGRGHKKGRGAGLRGGRGKAGAMKHKRVRTVQRGEQWGDHGFTRPQAVLRDITTMNVGELDEAVPALLEAGSATADGDAVQVDLGALGVDKLLGNGQASRVLHVTVETASASAVTKVEAAGGSITTTEA